MDINQLLWELAGALGLAPGNLAIILGVTIFAANTSSRLIPDTATGFLGYVRTTSSWIGLHIRNNSGTAPIYAGDGVVIPTGPESSLGKPAATVTDLVDANELTQPPVVKDPFGAAVRSLLMLIVVGFFMVPLMGCATTSDSAIASYTCTHTVLLSTGANAAIANAGLISDPVARQAAIDAANVTLNLVAQCNLHTGTN